MAETHAAVPLNGLVLGRYRPLRPLGSGGTGSVWHARDQKHDRDVALKIVPRTGTAGPRAEREATAAAHLQHPHCLRAYALARDADHVYIAYQYVPGRTLRHALQAGELDDAAAVEAAAQILEGLAHAHAHGIVHRDVKPSNVLLTDEPGISVRLFDFGLALMTEEETLTAAGDVPGTLAYISPERLAGKTAESATDVWSTGVLLWEALAGRHPFGSGPFLEIAKRIGRGAPSLVTARPDLPKPLVKLVDSALAVDPSRRPPAAKLASSLRRAARARPPRARVQVPIPHLHAPDELRRLLPRLLPTIPPALLAGWTSATLPFFPAQWSAGLAVLAAVLSFRTPRLGLVFALAVPILPLGNVARGLAVLYLVLACAWLAAFWHRPRAALLFVVGPLLAPLGALGLLPLATLPAGGPVRRAAQACAAVAAAVVAARLSGHGVPVVGGAGPDVSLGGNDDPLGAWSSLWGGVVETQGLLLETLALAGAATAVGAFRHRGPWGAAGFGALLCALTLLADPSARALPLVAAAWISAALLAAERGPARPMPSFSRFLRRLSPVRASLRLVAGR
jgi:Protein kinase domain